MRSTLVSCCLALFVSLPAAAQGPVQVEASNDSASITISLPGGVAADVEVEFEQVVGLTKKSLGVSADLIDPADLNLLSRLPGGVSIPAAFPMLLAIEPPATGPLSFRGIATVELHTHNLTYTALSPLRLFSGPAGGALEDITVGSGMGSYRVKGTKPGFSEFLIVADTRAVDDVIIDKFSRLQSTMDTHAASIAVPLRDDLQAHLDAAWSLYGHAELLAAIQEVKAFSDLVEENSGAEIPDVWRSSRDLDNVAGELRSGAGTLAFSLGFKASAGQ